MSRIFYFLNIRVGEFYDLSQETVAAFLFIRFVIT